MKKYLIVILLVLSVGIIVGCGKKKEDEQPTHEMYTTVEIGKKTYIEQQKNITIEGTEDYFIITEKVKWEVPEHDPDTTVSFSINIPYTMHVDGKDYTGVYQLNGYSESTMDKNPKYKFTITNLTKNYETEVLIEKK